MKKLILILVLVVSSISMGNGINEKNTGARLNVLFWTIDGTLDGEVRAGEGYRTRDYNGLDLNLLSLSKSRNFTGYQFSFFGMNKIDGNFTGVGQGLINYHKGKSKGIQFGTINIAENIEGAQWGILNTTKNLNGFQIGLINYAPNGIFPILPFFNISKSIIN